MFFDGSITTVDDEEVIAVGQFTPTQEIIGDPLTVTMNGIEYELPKLDLGGQVMYGEFNGGAPDFTNYPCIISPSGVFATQTGGTYTVKMSGSAESITTTDCFGKAVRSVVKELEHLLDGEADGSLRSNLATPEGDGYVLGEGAVAVGSDTKASDNYSHAEGLKTIASNRAAHAEGNNTTASGGDSHAEGQYTTASGGVSHAEGNNTTASGDMSHAEGSNSTASGYYSHAEGNNTTASGTNSHAEGVSTTASGDDSHAEGVSTTASGDDSHAQNIYTIAQGEGQTAIGKFNVAQGNSGSSASTDYAFIIGNGTGVNNRSNALAIKWDGTFVFANGTEITPAQFASLLALLNA